MQKSTIEWTDATWNPVLGCTPVSDGCRNCYAATIAHRFGKSGPMMGLADWRGGRAVFNGTISLREDRLQDPLRWKKPRRVFVNSMSDLFHESVPFDYVDKVWAIMALRPQHTFQVLTKRPERAAEYFARLGSNAADYIACAAYHATTNDDAQCRAGNAVDGCLGEGFNVGWPMRNVWLGTSVENQKAANERIPHLLNCPAAVRFLSCEPLLGPVGLGALPRTAEFHRSPYAWMTWLSRQIHWVIAGCESGKKARECDTTWLRMLRDECGGHGIAFFLKQMMISGKVVSLPELDGVRHAAMPAHLTDSPQAESRDNCRW